MCFIDMEEDDEELQSSHDTIPPLLNEVDGYPQDRLFHREPDSERPILRVVHLLIYLP